MLRRVFFLFINSTALDADSVHEKRDERHGHFRFRPGGVGGVGEPMGDGGGYVGSGEW